MPYFYPIDKEEQFAIVLALYILLLLGEHKPERKRVLRFIKARGLIRFYDDDYELRGREERWMNDLSWAREDLTRRGFLSMPEHGVWSLSPSGRSWIEERGKNWLTHFTEKPESKSEFLARCRRLNETFFAEMLRLGRGEDIRKRIKDKNEEGA